MNDIQRAYDQTQRQYISMVLKMLDHSLFHLSVKQFVPECRSTTSISTLQFSWGYPDSKSSQWQEMHIIVQCKHIDSWTDTFVNWHWCVDWAQEHRCISLFPQWGKNPVMFLLYSKKVGSIVVSATCSQIIFGLPVWIQGRAQRADSQVYKTNR